MTDYDAANAQALFFFQESFETIQKARKMAESDPSSVTEDMLDEIQKMEEQLDKASNDLDEMAKNKVFCISRLSE